MESYVEALVSKEPWRANHGQPKNALDPIWEGIEPEQCGGSIEFERTEGGFTGWWFCTSCGYCGQSSNTLHARVQHPTQYFLYSILFYYRKRVLQGVPAQVATQQAFFTAGMALRYAATLSPEQLLGFTQRLVLQ